MLTSRARWWMSGLVLAAVLALTPGPAVADIADRLDSVAKVPACTKWFNGSTPKPADFKRRVTLIHLSDPSRTTSKAFIGKLKKLHGRYGDRGFTLVEVVVDGTEGAAGGYSGLADVSWLVGHDGKGAVAEALPGSSVPRTYLIGPDGTILWHAHIGALKDTLIESLLDRASFFDPKSLPAKARNAAKAAAAKRYAKALAEARKLLDDPSADEDAKAVAAAVETDAEFWFGFQFKLAEAEIEDRDYGVGWARLDRLAARFKGTEYADRIRKRVVELEAWEIAVYVRDSQRRLDKILERAGSRREKDLKNMIRLLDILWDENKTTRVGERTLVWLKVLKKRLAEVER